MTYGQDVNITPSGDAYPGSGMTLGQLGGASGWLAGPSLPGMPASAAGDHVSGALEVGGQANPLWALAIFIGLLLLVMWLERRFGGDGFANLKVTFWNVLLIGFIAKVAAPVWTALFTLVKVPAISTWMLAH